MEFTAVSKRVLQNSLYIKQKKPHQSFVSNSNKWTLINEETSWNFPKLSSRKEPQTFNLKLSPCITVHKFSIGKFSLFLNASIVSSLTYSTLSLLFSLLNWVHSKFFTTNQLSLSWSPRPWQWSASPRSSLFSYAVLVWIFLYFASWIRFTFDNIFSLNIFFTEYILHLISLSVKIFSNVLMWHKKIF